MSVSEDQLRSCPHCGLVQTLPPVPPGMRACCPRCEGTLRARSREGPGNSRAAAIAVAALILYPLAVSLPLIEIERFGHANESSVLEGVVTLLGRGHLLVGLVVLFCSVIFPLTKLVALIALCTGAAALRPIAPASNASCQESHSSRLVTITIGISLKLAVPLI